MLLVIGYSCSEKSGMILLELHPENHPALVYQQSKIPTRLA